MNDTIWVFEEHFNSYDEGNYLLGFWFKKPVLNDLFMCSTFSMDREEDILCVVGAYKGSLTQHPTNLSKYILKKITMEPEGPRIVYQ